MHFQKLLGHGVLPLIVAGAGEQGAAAVVGACVKVVFGVFFGGVDGLFFAFKAGLHEAECGR